MAQFDRVPFVWQPLVEAVDRREAKAFAQRALGDKAVRGAGVWRGVLIGAFVVMAIFVISFVVAMFSMLLRSSENNSAASSTPIFIFFGAIGVVVIASVIVGLSFAFRGASGTYERMLKLARFAEANAMTYIARIPRPPLPGVIFAASEHNSTAVSTDVLRGSAPRVVEFGNYSYVTGSGDNQTTHSWGYTAIKVDNLLPNIILDAKANGTGFAGVTKNQQLRLEGNFNDFFSLYAPAGYETDALYLFTPDIMERFMSQAATLDVELVDNWVFFYSNRPTVTLDPPTWEWMFSLVQAVLTKIAQWERWRDDRRAGEPPLSTLPSVPYQPGALPGMPATEAPPLVTAPAGFTRQTPGVDPSGRRLDGRGRARTPGCLIVAFTGIAAFIAIVGGFIAVIAGGAGH